MKKILLVIVVVFTSFTGVRAQNFLGDFAKTMVGLTVNYKGAEISALLNHRITSYNVCYTKLLRT